MFKKVLIPFFIINLFFPQILFSQDKFEFKKRFGPFGPLLIKSDSNINMLLKMSSDLVEINNKDNVNDSAVQSCLRQIIIDIITDVARSHRNDSDLISLLDLIKDDRVCSYLFSLGDTWQRSVLGIKTQVDRLKAIKTQVDRLKNSDEKYYIDTAIGAMEELLHLSEEYISYIELHQFACIPMEKIPDSIRKDYGKWKKNKKSEIQ